MRRVELHKGYIIIYSNSIVRFLGKLVSLDNPYGVSFLWPCIFIRPDARDAPFFKELIRHEAIHMYQQLELLIIGYWLLYAIEYCYARIVKKFSARDAYYYTACEQEAHRNAMKADYLHTRKPYAVLKYLFDKKRLGRTQNGTLIVREYE